MEQPRADTTLPPVLTQSAILAGDGYRLPLQRWGPEEPEAVVLALHGFTEHSGVFARLAEGLAPRGIAVYAYDQRGFGDTDYRGIWPGREPLLSDAAMALALIQAHYPDAPVHLLGESMGAAIALLALTDEAHPIATPPASLILSAPAIWAREVMPWYQRSALWLGELLVPGLSFSPTLARRIADIQPTNDPEVVAEMQQDERMLRDVRADMLVGVTDLMDEALPALDHLPQPTLILYGLQDEIIPPEAACSMFRRIAEGPASAPSIALYPDGYHLLTRDQRAFQTIGDIGFWIEQPRREPASGQGVSVAEAQARACELKPARSTGLAPGPTTAP